MKDLRCTAEERTEFIFFMLHVTIIWPEGLQLY